MKRFLLAVAFMLAWTTVAHAQNVINPPRTLEFTASVDHDVTQDTPPVNLVTRYDVLWFASGAAQPFQTDQLGKPTPDATRLIRIDVSTLVMGIPIGIGYTAKIAAVGPGGQGVSAATSPFDVAVRAPTAPTGARLSR